MEAAQPTTECVNETNFWMKPENHRRNQSMHRNKWKWKHDNRKPMGFSKSSAKGKVHRNTNLPQETREISNK